MTYTIPLVMFFHWIADFVLQSTWMATGKSQSNKILAAHVGTYSAAMCLLCVPFFGFQTALLYASLNGILHFATDFVTSRVTTRLYKLEDKHWFYVMIGLDQLIHFLCLWATAGRMLV